jgi:hypothetical protein
MLLWMVANPPTSQNWGKKKNPAGLLVKSRLGLRHRSRAETGPDRVVVEKAENRERGNGSVWTRARELPRKGREGERESVCVRESDALLLCYAFVAVLFSGLHSLSAFVLRRNFFARVVCTRTLNRSSVCFIFRVVWFDLVCRVFFWLVGQPAVTQTCFCCLLPGVYIALAAWWVVRHRERERRTCLRSFRKEFFWGLFSTIL